MVEALHIVWTSYLSSREARAARVPPRTGVAWPATSPPTTTDTTEAEDTSELPDSWGGRALISLNRFKPGYARIALLF